MATQPIVMTAAERAKLAGIAAGAQVNPTRVTTAEKTAGTSVTVRGYAPADVRDIVATFAPTAPVASVAGKTGAVALTKDDVGLDSLSNDPQVKADLAYAAKATPTAGDKLLLKDHADGQPKLVDWNQLPVSSVASVHGRSGTVVAQTGDYTAEQIADGTAKVVMTAAERAKLAGVAAGAQVNTVASVHGRSGAVVAQAGDYTAEQIADGTTKVVMTADERARLAGIAAGAQVNPTRITTAEKTAGTSVTIRSYAPADVRDMVATFAPASTGGSVASVAGKTGAVTLLKDDVGLGKVSNDLQIKADPTAYSIKTAPDADDLLLLYDPQPSGPAMPRTVPWSSLPSATVPTILPGAVPFINAMASPYSADGTRATSAQAAIQNALEAAAVRKETVFLAGGRFKVISLRIPRGVNLVGAGPFSTLISQDETMFAADGGDSMIDALAKNVQVANGEDFPLYRTSGSGAGPYGYMKIAGKSSFAIPRIVTISSASGDADLSDLHFRISGCGPDFVKSGNPTGYAEEDLNGPENGGDPNTPGNRGTVFSKNIYTSNIKVTLIGESPAQGMGNRFVHIGIAPPPMVRLQQIDQKNPGVRNIGFTSTADASPYFGSRPVLVRDACAIQFAVEGASVNAPIIKNVYITGCMRGISLYGGIADSDEPGQKYGIQDIEIQCANTMFVAGSSGKSDLPPSTTHLNLACGFYLRGQVDTPTFINTNVKGWDDGGGQSPDGLNSIGYWWPSSRTCGQAKGGSGIVALGVQTRYLRYGFMIGEGQIRSALFYGDFENAHTLMWIGKNNKAIKIGGGFAHPGGYYGSTGSVFFVDSGSTLTVDYGFFEGSYQGNPWFCEGAGRIYFGEGVRFASSGVRPTIPLFNMVTPMVSRFTGAGTTPANLEELRLTDWSPYAKMASKAPSYNGMEDVSDVQCFIPPGQTMTVNLLGATTFKESAGGNLAVAIGSGTPGARSVTFSKQVTLLALATRLAVGSSTPSYKTVIVLSGA